jgi:carbon storage regulator
MLVLSRRKGESITIAGGITVHVLKVSASETRVGIEAPKDVKILRSELKPKEYADESTSDARPADQAGR